MTKKIAILHPWFPSYRKPFFDLLTELSRENGFELHIFYGQTPPEWNDRGDKVSASYAKEVPTFFYRFGQKYLIWHGFNPRDFDLVVLEDAVRNLEMYYYLIRGFTNLSLWGHGGDFTYKSSRLKTFVRARILKKMNWFFAYTSQGADKVFSLGFPAENTTVVNNSMDSRELANNLSEVSQADLHVFETKYDLKGKTALYMGGIDETKRIDLLLESAELVFERDKDFRLLIAGQGSQVDLVLAAAKHNTYINHLGRVEGKEKALALAASEILSIPGRVGLISVDSITSERPIVTSTFDFHAPELGYLEVNSDYIESLGSPQAYAQDVLELLLDKERLRAMRTSLALKKNLYTVESMAQRFLVGIQGALKSST